VSQNTETFASVKHLIELRRRLLQCLSLWLLAFILLYGFADKLFHRLAIPLLQKLPLDAKLVATSITSPFFVPLKFTAWVALFATLPIMFYLLWLFVAPALYKHERCWLWGLLLASTSLFYLGVGFAFFIVFPLVFQFFANITPSGISLLPDIENYLNFVLHMFLAFGIAFQVPIITILAVKLRWVTLATLRAKRPYIIVLAFILGMLLTPPDVLSQVLLALPMWGLFELALFISQRLAKV
jgi:sec-independent protein translocase protein TatC